MAPERDTTALVDRAGRGDRAAIEALLEAHLPGLKRFLRHRMGPALAAREESADLVQSVCREVLEHLGDERLRYRSVAEFRQWLYNAAMFKVRDRIKYWGAARRDLGHETAAPDASRTEQLFRTLWTPSQEASLQESLQRFAAAMDRLAPEQRQIIVLARLEGRSHREIAEQLGVSESHSRVLLARALARLARLRDEGE